ncbi:hypothetical protein [Serratia symbiotica]|uniref:Uncharacterized protein n=1 Tax=Serratia symbiotica TaxID=138074 RepID=A0A068Z1A5_9GAMM|nr:hypothetical protein [Serratia symbiotica]MBF1994647.1 hypothetical protein [Serratia symbiotica]QLH62052.1 hypothetical protein SYMBAF_02610 [Serratia symbiotica]CDS56001.1 conserved hypothetical protein [Serratia symbiotica]
MFRILITLINYEAAERRELVHGGRYKSREAAWKDAQKMAYIHKNAVGTVTHECMVKVIEVKAWLISSAEK